MERNYRNTRRAREEKTRETWGKTAGLGETDRPKMERPSWPGRREEGLGDPARHEPRLGPRAGHRSRGGGDGQGGLSGAEPLSGVIFHLGRLIFVPGEDNE